MKRSILALIAIVFSAELFAQEAPHFEVLERSAHNNGTYYHLVPLEDLTSADAFEGRYFKVVRGKSKDAISFMDERELVLKAATVYHHLTKARKFWLEHMGSEYAKNLPQITVRLDISNLYDQLGHFANDNRDPQFNNALSVPAGETPSWVPEHRRDKWGNEIWFRPMKYILSSTLPSIGPNPLTTALQTLERPFINFAGANLMYNVLERIFFSSAQPNQLWISMARFAGTVALAKVVIEASKRMDPLFMEKYYYLETAMVPEIVYHEYAHIVLNDALTLSHSTPVIEGMADYFAAVMADRRKVYGMVAGFSNSAPKDTQGKKHYNHWFELDQMATSDFVLSVLWDVRETVGGEVADRLIYEARKGLSTASATIHNHLLRAILNACEHQCTSPRRDKLRLYRTFSAKGF